MAGHSHWAGIKHKKAAVDAKRSKLWSKLTRAIIVAAKLGGGDPDANIRLRTAIQEAKSLSLPKDNIDRAIKKGTGEIDGGNVEEIVYEGYGPAGMAVLCDILTDNRNRTAPELRKIFDTYGGNLGGSGCVAYLFERKGIVAVSLESVHEEQVMEIALENEASDADKSGSKLEIYTAPELLSQLHNALEAAGIATEMSEVVRVPATTVEIDDSDTARKALDLLEALDDHDDVQSVATNLDFERGPVAEFIQS